MRQTTGHGAESCVSTGIRRAGSSSVDRGRLAEHEEGLGGDKSGRVAWQILAPLPPVSSQNLLNKHISRWEVPLSIELDLPDLFGSCPNGLIYLCQWNRRKNLKTAGRHLRSTNPKWAAALDPSNKPGHARCLLNLKANLSRTDIFDIRLKMRESLIAKPDSPQGRNRQYHASYLNLPDQECGKVRCMPAKCLGYS